MSKRTWPTPVASDSHGSVSEKTWGGYSQKQKEKRMSTLKDAVLWPTPLASEARIGYQRRNPGKKGTQQNLTTIVRDVTFPTPGTTGLSNGSGNVQKANELYEAGVITDEERKSFRAGNGGQLNPDWVSWLMGWPCSWTSLKPMRKEDYEEWREKAIKGTLWTFDPADLSPSDKEYIPRITFEKTFRQQRLKALGNGQVPSAACLAESILREVVA